MDGVVFFGNDLVDGCATRRSPDQCCQACQATRGCKAWTALLDTHPTCPGTFQGTFLRCKDLPAHKTW